MTARQAANGKNLEDDVAGERERWASEQESSFRDVRECWEEQVI